MNEDQRVERGMTTEEIYNQMVERIYTAPQPRVETLQTTATADTVTRRRPRYANPIPYIPTGVSPGFAVIDDGVGEEVERIQPIPEDIFNGMMEGLRNIPTQHDKDYGGYLRVRIDFVTSKVQKSQEVEIPESIFGKHPSPREDVHEAIDLVLNEVLEGYNND